MVGPGWTRGGLAAPPRLDPGPSSPGQPLPSPEPCVCARRLSSPSTRTRCAEALGATTSPSSEATSPFWPLPSLRPVERSRHGQRRVPGRTWQVWRQPRWTSRATAHQLAFVPFSVTAWGCGLARPAPATDRDCKEKDAAWGRCCQPCVPRGGDETCERCLRLGHPSCTPRDSRLRGHVAAAARQAWPWQGRRKDGCLLLVPAPLA